MIFTSVCDEEFSSEFGEGNLFAINDLIDLPDFELEKTFSSEVSLIIHPPLQSWKKNSDWSI